MSTEEALREIKGTLAEGIFIYLAETGESLSSPQIAKALDLPELDAQTACRWLETLGLVEYDGSLTALMHVSIQGQAAANGLLAERSSGKGRRAALRTGLLDWLGDSANRTDTADYETAPGASLYGSPFTKREILDETAFLLEKDLIKGTRAWGGDLLRPSLTADGRECVDRFDGDVNAWLSRLERGTVTHNQTTISNSPGAQSMSSSPGGQQTATVTISQDNRRQLLQIADQIAEQIAGLPAEVAPAATTGVEELRQAATVVDPDEGRVKAALSKIALGVAVAVGTDAGQNILGLVGQAAHSLGS